MATCANLSRASITSFFWSFRYSVTSATHSAEYHEDQYLLKRQESKLTRPLKFRCCCGNQNFVFRKMLLQFRDARPGIKQFRTHGLQFIAKEIRHLLGCTHNVPRRFLMGRSDLLRLSSACSSFTTALVSPIWGRFPASSRNTSIWNS
jgi:hypothetical protein